MGDISNKTLVSLLAVALVITIIGTVTSISNFGGFNFDSMVTGAVTSGTGSTGLTTASSASISITDTTASFGSGYVYGANTSANVWSNGTTGNGSNGSLWVNSSGLAKNPFHTVINDGNVDVNVTASVSIDDAEEFFCGTPGGCTETTSSRVKISALDNEASSCDDTESGGANETFQTIATDTGNATVLICDDLDYKDSGDTINVYFMAAVPSDSTSGDHNLTVTYTAVSKGTQN